MRSFCPIGFAISALALFVVAAAADGAEGDGREAGDRFGLLVGVRKYRPDELRDLAYAEADVDGLAATLRAAGYLPDNVVLMTAAAAARDLRFAPEAAKIRAELRLLLHNRS